MNQAYFKTEKSKRLEINDIFQPKSTQQAAKFRSSGMQPLKSKLQGCRRVPPPLWVPSLHSQSGNSNSPIVSLPSENCSSVLSEQTNLAEKIEDIRSHNLVEQRAQNPEAWMEKRRQAFNQNNHLSGETLKQSEISEYDNSNKSNEIIAKSGPPPSTRLLTSNSSSNAPPRVPFAMTGIIAEKKAEKSHSTERFSNGAINDSEPQTSTASSSILQSNILATVMQNCSEKFNCKADLFNSGWANVNDESDGASSDPCDVAPDFNERIQFSDDESASLFDVPDKIPVSTSISTNSITPQSNAQISLCQEQLIAQPNWIVQPPSPHIQSEFSDVFGPNLWSVGKDSIPDCKGYSKNSGTFQSVSKNRNSIWTSPESQLPYSQNLNSPPNNNVFQNQRSLSPLSSESDSGNEKVYKHYFQAVERGKAKRGRPQISENLAPSPEVKTSEILIVKDPVNILSQNFDKIDIDKSNGKESFKNSKSLYPRNQQYFSDFPRGNFRSRKSGYVIENNYPRQFNNYPSNNETSKESYNNNRRNGKNFLSQNNKVFERSGEKSFEKKIFVSNYVDRNGDKVIDKQSSYQRVNGKKPKDDEPITITPLLTDEEKRKLEAQKNGTDQLANNVPGLFNKPKSYKDSFYNQRNLTRGSLSKYNYSGKNIGESCENRSRSKQDSCNTEMNDPHEEWETASEGTGEGPVDQNTANSNISTQTSEGIASQRPIYDHSNRSNHQRQPPRGGGGGGNYNGSNHRNNSNTNFIQNKSRNNKTSESISTEQSQKNSNNNCNESDQRNNNSIKTKLDTSVYGNVVSLDSLPGVTEDVLFVQDLMNADGDSEKLDDALSEPSFRHKNRSRFQPVTSKNSKRLKKKQEIQEDLEKKHRSNESKPILSLVKKNLTTTITSVVSYKGKKVFNLKCDDSVTKVSRASDNPSCDQKMIDRNSENKSKDFNSNFIEVIKMQKLITKELDNPKIQASNNVDIFEQIPTNQDSNKDVYFGKKDDNFVTDHNLSNNDLNGKNDLEWNHNTNDCINPSRSVESNIINNNSDSLGSSIVNIQGSNVCKVKPQQLISNNCFHQNPVISTNNFHSNLRNKENQDISNSAGFQMHHQQISNNYEHVPTMIMPNMLINDNSNTFNQHAAVAASAVPVSPSLENGGWFQFTENFPSQPPFSFSSNCFNQGNNFGLTHHNQINLAGNGPPHMFQPPPTNIRPAMEFHSQSSLYQHQSIFNHSVVPFSTHISSCHNSGSQYFQPPITSFNSQSIPPRQVMPETVQNVDFETLFMFRQNGISQAQQSSILNIPPPGSKHPVHNYHQGVPGSALYSCPNSSKTINFPLLNPFFANSLHHPQPHHNHPPPPIGPPHPPLPPHHSSAFVSGAHPHQGQTFNNQHPSVAPFVHQQPLFSNHGAVFNQLQTKYPQILRMKSSSSCDFTQRSNWDSSLNPNFRLISYSKDKFGQGNNDSIYEYNQYRFIENPQQNVLSPRSLNKTRKQFHRKKVEEKGDDIKSNSNANFIIK